MACRNTFWLGEQPVTDYGVSLTPAWGPQGAAFAMGTHPSPQTISATSLFTVFAKGFNSTHYTAPALPSVSNGAEQWATVSQPTNVVNPQPASVLTLPSSTQTTATKSSSKTPQGTAKQQALYQKVLAACSHLPKQAAENIARLIAYRECNADESDPLKPRDIGDGAGLTAAGITEKYNPQVDFKNLTLKTIVDTYYEKYWVKENMDQYASNPMRQAMLFDACVGMGATDMKKVDARAGGKNATAKALAKARLSVYQEKPNWPKFGPGWTNRVNNELVPYAQSLESVPA